MTEFRKLSRPAVMLFIICLVATALLAVTNSITAKPIAEQAEKAEIAARVAVLPGAESFSENKTVSYKGSDFENGEYRYNEAYDSNGSLIGYAITSSAKGYGGAIQVMTGVNLDGEVTGVEILEMSETAGLGMNAAKEEFRKQFLGKILGIEVSTATNKASSDNAIDALTGATITSKAVTQAVNLALTLYGQTGGAVNG